MKQDLQLGIVETKMYQRRKENGWGRRDVYWARQLHYPNEAPEEGVNGDDQAGASRRSPGASAESPRFRLTLRLHFKWSPEDET